MIAFAILLPLSHGVLRVRSGLWSHWKRFALLGFLGVGNYNALQYLALQTSAPLNVTRVAASLPLWMLAVGALFLHARVTRMQLLGALLSMGGVAVVLSRGQWVQLLQLRMVAGDLFTLVASASWAGYSWLLARRDEPASIRSEWAAFLMGQVVFGLAWSGLYAGAEWTLTDVSIARGWPLAAGLA